MLETMIPDTNNRIWKELIKGQKTVSFDFLAANILTQRIRTLYNGEPSEENLQNYTRQLRELFIRNSELPHVKKDIDKLRHMGI